MSTAALDQATTRPLPPRAADAAIGLRQVRYEHLMFWRTRRRAFFAFGLPMMFLLLFSAINGNGAVDGTGGRGYLTFFCPGILAYGVIMATFTNLVASLAVQRDSGVLKRVQGTPLPAWAFLAGSVGAAALVATELTALTLAVADLAFGVDVPWHALPGLVSAIVVGAVAFSALGVGLSRGLGGADSAAPAASFIVLPLTFISGIWYPAVNQPTWLTDLAGVFPVRRLADALQHAYDPSVHGAAVAGLDLLVLAGWGLVGMRLTQRFLRSQTASA